MQNKYADHNAALLIMVQYGVVMKDFKDCSKILLGEYDSAYPVKVDKGGSMQLKIFGGSSPQRLIFSIPDLDSCIDGKYCIMTVRNFEISTHKYILSDEKREYHDAAISRHGKYLVLEYFRMNWYQVKIECNLTFELIARFDVTLEPEQEDLLRKLNNKTYKNYLIHHPCHQPSDLEFAERIHCPKKSRKYQALNEELVKLDILIPDLCYIVTDYVFTIADISNLGICQYRVEEFKLFQSEGKKDLKPYLKHKEKNLGIVILPLKAGKLLKYKDLPALSDKILTLSIDLHSICLFKRYIDLSQCQIVDLAYGLAMPDLESNVAISMLFDSNCLYYYNNDPNYIHSYFVHSNNTEFNLEWKNIPLSLIDSLKVVFILAN